MLINISMNTIEFNVQEPYHTFILNGVKTVEGRLNKGKFAALKIGDRLSLNKQTLFEVIAIVPYDSFRDMIEAEGVQNIVPDKQTTDEAVQVYYRFYTPLQEKECGVLAIRIKKLN